ncbi:xanthine dehydrogenase small subunit [Marinomonas posidonica]|uniref:Xanthine dehydrogenase, small subunit n=1 Tax=Marinomonas posidonica (strain CECT 7376 / NCIMB 14433 / IVIA-Po-181) TaxID=491952 RepID=F6CX84_MARPP|nr:xanthine dehydrogenase small subunit [Marinomonas posidonica]AEF54437.1 xanthine dehydrogenase, small subunit [Marinomonas posidonica IVIA-Po-181]
MKFILNDKIVEETSLPSDFTALRYLREKRGLTGTKEGCASGDCGACTLLVGALEEGELTYTTLNACITPLQSLAGKHLVSVEHLASLDEGLHPAQQAMVDAHGSQCGFCTPGFVLSLASLYENAANTGAEVDRESVCDAISGNLCRCTGYRPIIEAGLAMADRTSHLLSQKTWIKSQLAEIENSMAGAQYVRPETLAQLHQAKQRHPDAEFIAGGTDLMLENTQRYRDFDVLIDLTRVAEMKQIIEQEGDLVIGAGVTYSELEDYSQTAYPHLYQLLSRIASRQIRNRGTLGGNVANGSPIADMPPILLAFDADIRLDKIDGSSREINIQDFYLGYKQTALAADECIVSFRIRLAKLASFHRFYKVSKRMEDDISSVLLASRFDVKDGQIGAVRLAFGGMAATPIRALATEACLTQMAISDEQALEVALQTLRGELTPMSDMRASAKYRIDMACNLIRKAWLELNGMTVPTFSGHPVPSAWLELGQDVGKQEASNHA